MKHYLKIYYMFVKLSLSELLAFRGHFYHSSFSHMSWAIFSFVTVFLLTSKSKIVYGWTREELFLLIGVFNILIGIFRSLFTKNFDRLALIIHKGELDHYLLKPIDSQFFLSLKYVNTGALARIPLAIAFTIYICYYAKISLSFNSILLFILIIPISIILLYSFWYIVMTIIIWFTNLSNLEELLNNTTSAARFPKEMFENLGLFILLITLPFVLVMTVPAKTLLRTVSAFEIFQLILLAVILFTISRMFWKFALKSYASAS